ncbi:MAG: hypothetical protein Q4G47_01090 [Lachnospiraceae bacterium]|nr:hypothetical protein [Lachnospiraceae bacterium]
MKSLNRTRRTPLYAAVCAAALLFAFFALSALTVRAEDEEKKVKLSAADFTTDAVAAESTAKAIKRDRTYKVRIPSDDVHSFGSGFLSFTAPESGTWVLRLFGLSAKSDYGCGTVNVLLPSAEDPGRLELRSVRTKGGYADTLYIATENAPGAATGSSFRTSRNAWLSLDKGQTIWLYFYFPAKSSVRLRAELSEE